MMPEDIEKLMQAGSDILDDMISRPWEYTSLQMELKTAIEQKDVDCCRELLQEKGMWLARLKGHELTELMDAAIRSEEAADEFVDLLLQSGVPAHCVYDHIGPNYQHTPLVTAARLGRIDIVQKLVAAGADIFWTSPTGANALSEIQPSKAGQAPMDDSPELATMREWLMQQGLRIDPLCDDSCRKLMWASGQPDSWPDVSELMALGIPSHVTGWTPFMLNMAFGKAEVSDVAKLTIEELHHRDAWNRTPFLLAVTAGQLEMASALIERGSDIHARGHCGDTALHLAAKFNHCSLIEWLLERGIPLDVRDHFSNSALYEAVSHDCVDAVKLLLEKGSDVHERDKNGFGLIHEVSLDNDLVVLKLLLDAGADVNDISGGGDWPLKDACRSGNVSVVAFLLHAGANPNLTSTGETALFSAVASDNLECVRLLLDAGADVNATDCDGWTCLFYLRSEKVANYLLEHGANADTSDQCGGLPEDWESVPMAVRRLLRKWRTRRM